MFSYLALVRLLTIILFTFLLTACMDKDKEKSTHPEEAILIYINFQGNDALFIADRIVGPIERELGQLEAVGRIESASYHGVGFIMISFPTSVEINERRGDVNRALEAARKHPDFPDLPLEPLIYVVGDDMYPVLTLHVKSANHSAQSHRELAEELKGLFESQKEVSGVTIEGIVEEHDVLRLSPQIMMEYQVSFSDIENSFLNENIALGRFSGPEDEVIPVQIDPAIDIEFSNPRIIIPRSKTDPIRWQDLVVWTNHHEESVISLAVLVDTSYIRTTGEPVDAGMALHIRRHGYYATSELLENKLNHLLKEHAHITRGFQITVTRTEDFNVRHDPFEFFEEQVALFENQADVKHEIELDHEAIRRLGLSSAQVNTVLQTQLEFIETEGLDAILNQEIVMRNSRGQMVSVPLKSVIKDPKP